MIEPAADGPLGQALGSHGGAASDDGAQAGVAGHPVQGPPDAAGHLERLVGVAVAEASTRIGVWLDDHGPAAGGRPPVPAAQVGPQQRVDDERDDGPQQREGEQEQALLGQPGRPLSSEEVTGRSRALR